MVTAMATSTTRSVLTFTAPSFTAGAALLSDLVDFEELPLRTVAWDKKSRRFRVGLGGDLVTSGGASLVAFVQAGGMEDVTLTHEPPALRDEDPA